MAKNIVALGSLAFDSIETPSGQVTRALGGSLSHFINAAAKQSHLNMGILGVVGDDFGPREESFFVEKNIDLTDMERVAGQTFFWSGYYEKDMNQAHTRITELNVFSDFKPRVSPVNQECDILFLANIDPELQLEVISKVRFRYAFLDTMNYWLTSKRDAVLAVLPKITGFIINEEEAFILTEEANYLRAAEKILTFGPQYLIIKRGNSGVVFMGKDGSLINYPAFPIKGLVDPTGAGDSFAGGFVSYLADRLRNNEALEESFKAALVYATVMASFNVEGFGLEGLAPITKEDVAARIMRYREYSSFPNFN
ncbi:MAG: sugar kinase [Spirochaetae bacterium HGW-Spirochaetae-6]|jgi:sugar/nucleoside kinase (ribokinase family)|nr:MAG: sugar kinase [Spirochaetae bacterium HGW-Spirochaetae-6]